ncbi:MAG: tRNA lysidine(34) synthetase TilS [Chloroflexi bacterium]|nr:tRNA lysidine(34) synthetase TilS [Chloroflexota bacterium]
MGESVVVGVSGGQDSLCLIHLLNVLKDQLGITIYAAHLDHLLRDAESAADARYVQEIAAQLGVSCIFEGQDVQSYRREHRLTLEDAARKVRYDFLARVCERVGATKIAVGHTADDQAETILMHWMRGSGLVGLRGMQPISTYRWHHEKMTIIRPLLEVRRSETGAYCASLGLQPRRDSTNLSLRHFRNRIRLKLLPALRAYNPRIDEAILRLARASSDDLDFIQQEVGKTWNEMVTKEPTGLAIKVAPATNLHPSLLRHLFRTMIEKMTGNVANIRASHIEAMTEAVRKPVGTRITLPGGLVFTTGYDSALLSFGEETECPWPILGKEYPLSVPGETAIPGWLVEAQLHKIQDPLRKEERWYAQVDFDCAGSELSVRQRRPGDRFQPLGMEIPKKLQDFMVDAKIPRSWRDRIPLVVSRHQIVWVVGWRIDERVKLTSSTTQVLSLGFRPIP